MAYKLIQIPNNTASGLTLLAIVESLDKATGNKHGLFEISTKQVTAHGIGRIERGSLEGELFVVHGDLDILTEKVESFVAGFMRGQHVIKWLTVADLAKSEGLHADTICKEIKRGRLKADFRQYRWHVNAADVPAWRQRRFEEDRRRKSNKQKAM